MFTLKPLKYAFNALEPYYDAKTVEIHHTKHHQSYVTNLNNALEKLDQFKDLDLNEILTSLDKFPNEIKTTVRNNAGGIFNHDLFWDQFSQNPKPISNNLLVMIEKDFKSFDNFKTEFETKAKTNFGSSWTFLVQDNNQLKIVNLPNHDCPVSNNQNPLMVIDVWEHAYYLKFQNRRNEWIDSFWNILDWEVVESNLDK